MPQYYVRHTGSVVEGSEQMSLHFHSLFLFLSLSITLLLPYLSLSLSFSVSFCASTLVLSLEIYVSRVHAMFATSPNYKTAAALLTPRTLFFISAVVTGTRGNEEKSRRHPASFLCAIIRRAQRSQFNRFSFL